MSFKHLIFKHELYIIVYLRNNFKTQMNWKTTVKTPGKYFKQNSSACLKKRF